MRPPSPAHRHRFTAWPLGFVAFIALFFALLNARLPQIGHDYPTFFSYLIEGRWHVAHFGFAPLRFAPHLCGGAPLYGNPNDLFYSPAQILVLAMDPLSALQLSMLAVLALGYCGWWLFGRHVVGVRGGFAHLLALIAVSEGFYLIHMAVGHVNFLPFPLLGLLAWLLFDRRSDTPRAFLRRCALFALTAAGILHAGGFYVLIFFALGAVLFLPLEFLGGEPPGSARLRTLAARAGLSLLLTLALSASKLVAVWSLMRFFTRTAEYVPLPAWRGAVAFISSALFAFPQRAQLFMGLQWLPHEASMYLSPVVLLGLCAGGLLAVRAAQVRPRRVLFALRAAYALGLLWVISSLTTGRGAPIEFLFGLPVMSSLRVTFRHLYLFALLLTCLSVLWLQRGVRLWAPRAECRVAAGAMAVTLVAFIFAHRTMLPSLFFKSDYREYLGHLRATEASLERDDPVTRVASGDPTFMGTTSILCTEDALFHWARQPQAAVLRIGPVTEIRDGYFNMMNPACYQYPEENGCKPLDRIAVADAENFERFRTGGKVTWSLSRFQRIADTVSLSALPLILFLLFLPCLRFPSRSSFRHTTKK